MALSFACAAPEFERCYLQPREAHQHEQVGGLFPAHVDRLALLAGNLLIYGPNEVSGRFHILCGRFDWGLPTCCVFLSMK